MVVSGMAKGIDGAAMRGALRFGRLYLRCVGRRCGRGVPRRKPASVRGYRRHGVLLSEYPPRTEPEGWRFPMRNRILSGLSVAAVVVEAPLRSAR